MLLYTTCVLLKSEASLCRKLEMAPSCVHHCPTIKHLSVSSKNVHKAALYMYMEVLVMDVGSKFVLLLRY